MFLFGPGVKGRIHGEHLSLAEDKMVHGRNLQFKVDFGSVYAAVLEKWRWTS